MSAFFNFFDHIFMIINKFNDIELIKFEMFSLKISSEANIPEIRS